MDDVTVATSISYMSMCATGAPYTSRGHVEKSKARRDRCAESQLLSHDWTFAIDGTDSYRKKTDLSNRTSIRWNSIGATKKLSKVRSDVLSPHGVRPPLQNDYTEPPRSARNDRGR